jgi:hypothetical protein
MRVRVSRQRYGDRTVLSYRHPRNDGDDGYGCGGGYAIKFHDSFLFKGRVSGIKSAAISSACEKISRWGYQVLFLGVTGFSFANGSSGAVSRTVARR